MRQEVTNPAEIHSIQEKNLKDTEHYILYWLLSLITLMLSSKIVGIFAFYNVKQMENYIQLLNVKQVHKYSKRARIFIIINFLILALKLFLLLSLIIGMIVTYQEYTALITK